MTFTVGRGNHIGILWPLNIKNIGLLFPDDPPKLSLPITSDQGFEEKNLFLAWGSLTNLFELCEEKR